MKILVVDVGGTNVKILASGQQEARKFPSGADLSAKRMIEGVQELAKDWEYDVVTIGYPGPVVNGSPLHEPVNLGRGWVGVDFPAEMGKPVKVINDAAMQALGSYEGGRMLFLGLGTGVGSTLIAGHVVVPLELGSLMYDGERTVNQMLGRRGFERLGKDDWRQAVNKTLPNG